MRRFVLGDIHGNYKALQQVFERSGFNPSTDRLIFLGDVADGWPEVYECVELLLTVDDLVAIEGNHDRWTLEWMIYGSRDMAWLSQGGRATVTSYRSHGRGQPDRHIKFFRTMVPYHDEGDGKLFVHAGFQFGSSLLEQRNDDMMWTRALAGKVAKAYTAAQALVSPPPESLIPWDGYDEVYIGHTTTERFSDEPVEVGGVWMMDQGAGWTGRLSIMDIDTKEFWQSEPAQELYPDVKGR